MLHVNLEIGLLDLYFEHYLPPLIYLWVFRTNTAKCTYLANWVLQSQWSAYQ